MHGIEEGLLDKGCAEASDLLYNKRSENKQMLSGLSVYGGPPRLELRE